MKYVYIDYEYVESRDRTRRKLICVATYDYKEKDKRQWWILNDKIREDFIDYIREFDLNDTTFIGWAIGGAEVPCTVQIFGDEVVKEMNWMDEWVEYKMFSLTHPDFIEFCKKDSLLSAIECLNLSEKYIADKGGTLDLIIYDNNNRRDKLKTRIETGDFNFTPEEMKKILFYCSEDTSILHDIAIKLTTLARNLELPNTVDNMIARGEFCKNSGISYECSVGFPMDKVKVNAVFENRERIKRLIQNECNQKTGVLLYVPKYKGPVYNKTLVGYSFNHENFEKYLNRNKLLTLWERTEKGGRLRLDEEYLDEMISNFKDILEPLYNARNTLKQLNSTDLAQIMSAEGNIKCPPFPFHQKTSRSSPKPKLGFILNLSPWLRMLLRPAPGRAFVSIDFKSQEILIAAVLSKDAQMLDSYLNDFYMSTAIKTGFAPENATKKTHGHIRTPFKGISLGTLYGLQTKSLSFKFMHLNKTWTQHEAFHQAKNYQNNHKDIHKNYWQFVENNFIDCQKRGYFYLPCESNWIYFVSANTRQSQIQNLPCQFYGAEMMRYSFNECTNQGVYTMPLHDALNFECSEYEAVSLAKKVSKIMCEQSARLLGYDYMGTETKIFTHKSPYYDERGVDTYNLIMNELKMETCNSANKPTEYSNIHELGKVTLS